jgi:hypothetical protein
MSNTTPTYPRSTRRWLLLAAIIVAVLVLVSWAVTGNPLAVLGNPSGPGGALNLVVS